MKTPFDGAIRVGQREIDEMRIAISVEVDQRVRIARAREDNERETRRQRELASDDTLFSSHAYMARMRAERTRLNENQAVVDTRLTQMRAKAVAAYGTLRAVSSAADTWRVEAETVEANVEQGHLDDLTNAKYVLGQVRARRGGA